MHIGAAWRATVPPDPGRIPSARCIIEHRAVSMTLMGSLPVHRGCCLVTNADNALLLIAIG